MTARTTARAAAVLGATAALTVAGAGAAMAATATHDVEGNTVSVTFTRESGDGAAKGCAAVITPVASAAEVAAELKQLANFDLTAIQNLLSGNTAATLVGFTVLIPVVNTEDTVSTTVEPNVYSLVSYCVGEDPNIVPALIVGNPLEAIQGSVSTMSSGDSVGALSTIMQPGNGGSSNPLGDTGSAGGQ